MSSGAATGSRETTSVTCRPEDRDDLELWLMEQAFRYCRALERPARLARRLAAGDPAFSTKIDTTPPLQALETC